LGGRRSVGRPLLAVAALAAIAGAMMALLIALSQGESHTAAELKVQRSQLALLSRQLLQVKEPLRREIASSRAVWSSIAKGLPEHPDVALLQGVRIANDAAQALPAPAFLEVRHELIGPAERISSLFHSFELLTQRGWAHIDQAVATLSRGPASVASFERLNAGLYIDSVYDGSFDASLIGERVLNSYKRLGGGPAFGSSLTPAQVSSIATTYSPAAIRLTPHLWRELLAQR
jgi:hypothetical protein